MTTEAGRLVLDRVVRRIGEVSPAGLGRWRPAWDIVADPSDRFLDTLRLWESEDSPATRAKLQAAADAFVTAWRLAARRWKDAGQPQRQPCNEITVGGASR